MKLLHIVGRKNHGKTALVVDLVAEFCRRGLRVGTIKHSSHAHDLDKPGTDSYRHRQAGAVAAAIVTPELLGVFVRRRQADFYHRLSPLYAECDLVLVEGDIEHSAPKIEVWRAGLGTRPLAPERGDILAIVTDDPVEVAIPIWPRSDVAGLADRILRAAGK